MKKLELKSIVARGEDSRMQFKLDIRNPILVSYVAKGLLPYHGLGSGIKRALDAWRKLISSMTAMVVCLPQRSTGNRSRN